ncbi:hypothetical protein [Nannocystis sp. SCPEA4]|uniref:hypothetical protein n=1 Tax=Nannocystis sp. SCPEA4 TaxID=2996787 RepID=UPI0022713C98|nr:hypothetical protein [Nannocystis sp. SCPEA4]MCY1062454.1 hypothetical protein [Nannocystis sp. SCPEA4]
MKPPPEDDLKDMFVVLDPPRGGLQRFRARRDAAPPPHWPWWLGGAAGLATAAATLVLTLRPVVVPHAPAPPVASTPAPAPVDLIARHDLRDLHPAWIGLGRIAPPGEPLQLAPELTGALASRRVALPRQDVVLYMLDAKAQVP